MEKIFNVLAKGKNKILDFIPEFTTLVNNEEINKEDLLLIKNDIYQVKKNDLLDDFLLVYIDYYKPNFDSINELLKYLNHPLSRRLIINLINYNVINADNVDVINEEYNNVKNYYDIINNKKQFSYDIDEVIKSYRNVLCYDKNWFQFHTNQIGCIPVLDEEKELFLFLERDKENKHAVDYLIMSNLRLVRSLAKTYSYKLECKDVEELYQNGVLGLINAVNNYNIYTGMKFSTYATLSISRAIRREYLKDRLIYIPTDIVEGTKNRTDEDTLIAIENASKSVLSLDAGIDDSDDEATFGDLVSPSDEVMLDCEFYKPVEEIAELHDMIDKTDKLISSCLTEEEKNILLSYIVDGKTQKEIVSLYSLNMTHQNVSLKIKKIFKKLKESKEMKQILSYIVDDYKKEVPMVKNNNEVTKEIKNTINKIDDPYNYRQITKDHLMRNFGNYPFITEEDIENELCQIDSIISLKHDILKINNCLQDELMKKNVDNLKIIKIVRKEALYLKRTIGLKNLNVYHNEIDFLVSLFDIYSDPKKAKDVDHMEFVYNISEMDKYFDPTPLLNYMSADNSFYLLVADHVRAEEKDGIVDTLITVLSDVNTPLYSLVRTACINYYKDYSTKLIESMLEKVIKTYDGSDMMFAHVNKTVKEEYEIEHGKYIPPIRENEEYQNETIKEGSFTEHEYYGHYMKIWELIETNDKDYLEFLKLKFKELRSFDELISLFPKAYQYYIDAINFINNDIKKDDVKSK